MQTMKNEQSATILINGEWHKTDNVTPSFNPATKEEIIGYFSEGTINHTEAAINSANQAYLQWSKFTAVQRAQVLKNIATMLSERKNSLAELITKEMGKPLQEALGEVEVAIQTAIYFSGEGKKAMGEVIPSMVQGRHIHTVRTSIGVIGCITPWNYPISLAAYKIFSAFIAGNTVVWKPSPEVNCTATQFTSYMVESGLPPGILNLVTSSSPEVGEYIVSHKDVPLLTFTGSTNVGIKIAQEAAKQLKRVTLELGGLNAAIVMKDADIDLAVSQIVASGYGTSGQRCTATRRVFIYESIKDLFLEKLIQATSKLIIGNGLKDSTQVGPIINETSLRQIDGAVQKAIEEGAKLVIGGHTLMEDEGYYYAPTILDDIETTFEIAQEEVFGPVLSIITFDHYEQVITWNNDTKYGLSTAVFTNDLSIAMQAQNDISTGLVYINAGTANAELGVPFGGLKMSGNGQREVSHHTLDFMTEWKSVYISYGG
ncbi:aldehyde dehydrogenase [Lysinibacillus sp. RC79]|uniref:aldehyde dehydrogenase family protein n=1 Tax=Lysinibacillus sp. RC79 TaxID=3156296 RepID=UPI0035131220